MKKYIIISLLCAVPAIVLKAQYILTARTILPVLELKDKQLEEQLDSILFIAYPNTSYGDKVHEYIYLTNVEEKAPDSYIIDIVFLRPSVIEENVNTGIYKLEDKGIFIVREKSKAPLFIKTCKEEKFIYRKFLVPYGKGEYELEEIVRPEQFFSISLFYDKKSLEVLDIGG